MPYVVIVVAALTVQEVFTQSQLCAESDVQLGDVGEKNRRLQAIKRTWAGQGQSLSLGDVMVLLGAVGACEYANCTLQFCQRNGLRHKAMVEIRKLRIQLTNEVNLILPHADLCVDPKMPPPNELQIKLLRQIVLAGLQDHVARKMPESQPNGDEQGNRNAYQSLELQDPVFIHPDSVLHREAPEFVVYQEIFETSKLFMKVVAAVEAEWLPVYAPKLCNFSKPLVDPPPRYDPETGHVVCHVTVTFGPHAWQLPDAEIEHPMGREKYRWFARFLLEGRVFASLEKHVSVLLSSPSTMVKSWARLQPRTESLLTALVSRDVHSHGILTAAWNKEPSYLLNEYLEWLPESLHSEVKGNWPPT